MRKFLIFFLIFAIIVIIFPWKEIKSVIEDKEIFDSYHPADKKDIIKTTKDTIIYENIEYCSDQYGLFNGRAHSYAEDNKIILSWSNRFPFPAVSFYSYTSEEPFYICTNQYLSNGVDMYFHPDYNYNDDTFIVEGTNVEIKISDIVDLNQEPQRETKPNEFISKNMYTEIILSSNSIPTLKCDIILFKECNIWYVKCGCNPTLGYYITNLPSEIIDMFYINEIIPEK